MAGVANVKQEFIISPSNGSSIVPRNQLAKDEKKRVMEQQASREKEEEMLRFQKREDKNKRREEYEKNKRLQEMGMQGGLLLNDALPNTTSLSGDTPLHLAAQHGYAKVVEEDATQNPSDVEVNAAKRTLDEASSAAPDEPEAKKPKTKGQNKNRPRTVPKMEYKDRLCRAMSADNRECQYGSRCKFTHNIAEYLLNKKPDIGPECLHFIKKGKCPFGFECRYGAQHISSDAQNIVDEEKSKKYEEEGLEFANKNFLSKETCSALRKKKYDFTNSSRVLKLQSESKEVDGKWSGITKECSDDGAPLVNEAADANGLLDVTSTVVTTNPTTQVDAGSSIPTTQNGGGAVQSDLCNMQANPCINELSVQTNAEDPSSVSIPDVSTLNTTTITTPSDFAGATPTGTVTDEDIISLRPSEKKTIDFSDKLSLAPLTTVGNLPFRRICKRFGADVTCGEMAVTNCLLRGQQSEWALLRRHHTEDLFGVQLCGSYPDQMVRCTELLNRECSIDFIDINVGCPIDLVFKRGEGSALMTRTNKLRSIVSGMTAISNVPITVKMRTGVYEGKSVAHKIIPMIRECGASLATLHGRSREQRYTREADWPYIRECAELARPMPLYGNGDVLSYEDAQRCRDMYGVDGLMIARGALIKPWIFTEIKEQRDWDISSSERFDILKDYTNHGLEHWGSDDKGVESTRRFLLEWLSFLYRYIPVGVLECPPQRINERPPAYRGRDDLETLFASPRASDWVAITERLLGPVPHNFQFVPKHRANSYA